MDITSSCVVGVVKWFGGYDSKRQKENNYGFAQSIDGGDVYINKAMLHHAESLDEGDLVLIDAIEGNKKKVVKVSSEGDGFLLCYQVFHENKADFTSGRIDKKLSEALVEAFRFSLKNSSSFSSTRLIESPYNVRALEEFIGFISTLDVVGGANQSDLLFSLFYHAEPLPFLLGGIAPDLLPKSGFIRDTAEFLNALERMEEDDRDRVVNKYHEVFPSEVILAAVARQFLEEEQLSVREKNSLLALIEGSFKSPGNVDVVVRGFMVEVKKTKKPNFMYEKILLCILKKNIFEKNLGFYRFYLNHSELERHVDAFVLSSLMHYYIIGNQPEEIIKIIVSGLWKGLVLHGKGYLNQDKILSLFPPCTVMGGPSAVWRKSGGFESDGSHFAVKQLSCEAVYWGKLNTHLCRGKKCGSPRVYPDPSNKHYLDYSIYDWLNHYGIQYLGGDYPARQDFPIKLAGYLNRLREILERLQCRVCGIMMEPNLSYARVSYLDFSNGKVEEKEMSAAYRATVFRCGSEGCVEKGKNVYLNHCISFGCYGVIDSRDCAVRCDAGRYVCYSCGGCCESHAKSRPVGICPECGSSLLLYEDIARKRKLDEGKSLRFVVCENRECSFHIKDPLPKKFYLDSCGPVHKYDSRVL